MRNESNGIPGEEQVRADNEYLKLKLMLERGAQFAVMGEAETLPPEIENRFLRDIIEFESLNDSQSFVKVFDKLGRPTWFRPEKDIPDSDIEVEWEHLVTFLSRHQITVGVCSPNASARDLYRFVTEELFYLQISSVDMPGLVHGFIYDEFHPDPYHDNPGSAIEGFMKPLFAVQPFYAMHFFRTFDLRLNEHYPLNQRQFMNLVNHFKVQYERFGKPTLTNIECSITEDICEVRGLFSVCAWMKDGGSGDIGGAWVIEFRRNMVTGVWDIVSAGVEGIPF